jgi:two-component system sensor histidine kinase/response regulator
MRNLKEDLKKLYQTSPLEKLIISKEVRKVNLIRSLMLSGICVPIALVLSLTYAHSIDANAISFIDWRKQILILNFVVGIICSILFALSLLAYYKTEYRKSFRHLPHIILLVVALWGTTCSIFDQAVTSSIVGFLIICVVCSLILMIKPLRLMLYLGIIYVVFGYGMSQTQQDPSILVSNLSVGLITLVICLGLSTIQWRGNIRAYKQRRLIKAQKKELEENYKALLESSQELKEVNHTKDKFFSILAHDLRGPISSTLALTELLEEGFFEEDEAERKRMYKLLQTSLFTTGKLLENVLLWSRSQTGNISFKPCRLSVSDVVDSNINLLKIMAAQKDIQVINQTDPDSYIVGDEDMINTIFRNLISNAIKFTPNFGKIEVVSGQAIAENGSQMVTISVIDYGVGMNDKILKRLFRADNKTATPGTNNETGTGLGLVLCKEFVQQHAGEIQVKSKEAEGSTFTVSLPAST